MFDISSNINCIICNEVKEMELTKDISDLTKGISDLTNEDTTNDLSDLTKLTKPELLAKCKECGMTKYKTKNKTELINLLQQKPIKQKFELIIEEDTPNVNEALSISTYQNTIDIQNISGMEYLNTISNGSIDLILTDPPYIISKDSGMNEHFNIVKFNEDIKYGSIYGKKYCVKTDYGNWDSEFTMEILEQFISEYYKKLKKGGTLIMFFDLWKITDLKHLLEKYKFKQIRFIEWIKTNPQPRNSKVNYLTNCREIALIGVKEGNPTFNSSYDNGIYMFPLQGGKNRFHPTQKSLGLFEELIKKHSNENDTILDTFLGSGTTAIACKKLKRNFKGCEISKEYYDKTLEIL
jgi:site-specific DNA-methyltransferase (adenine-specific)